ncbi:putative TPR domain protein; O-GlcNAc transferase related protein [Bradyrhizobium sp. ORS 285]|uniref:tetratricopeptide repeat-containing glycosyltransferase family protein n=1 Tax=Bradyrhizobium sp. ORS 285 TaxID=115808 RepID=UPI0002406D9A|nr:tetratricopeptide repeat-containing glycosyltransferase family protein [Bradyrhizobium sp. ORS 285]CCD87867.1 putative TPR domain protein; O-GlcNAc transferase related protein [Bradyrhizobium sp. ORS 285]SMX62159.1 putative TPR domain protein; O-GlcNAc transferase related protein [Bradyrhizobium sp. ORS 285]
MSRRERRASPSLRASKTSSNGSRLVNPAALYETAFAQFQAGKLLEAMRCCQDALAVDPNHSDAMHLMGLLSLRMGQNGQAIDWFARAIKLAPKSDYVSSLGSALRKAGRLEDALKAFDKAVSLQPDNAQYWKDLGAVLAELDRPDDAILSLRHALQLSPEYVDAANLCGLLLCRRNRFAEALELFDISVKANPGQAEALHMRALVLQNLGRLEEAAADGLRSQMLDPANFETHNNLGWVLHRLGRHEQALACFDRALSLRPDYVLALKNKADLLADGLRFEEAMACHERVQTIAPSDPITIWNMALIHMVTGNFEAGWLGREIRWKTGLGIAHPDFAQPQWSGDDCIRGKTILIFADEGLGDAFQFARYVPMVAELGAKVILAVQDPASSLLSRLAGVTECIPRSTAASASFDLHCSMSSLPLAFKTTLRTIPADVPYLPSPLPARQAEWERRLGPHDRLRVGLVWSGNPGHSNDRNRSVPLQLLTRLLDIDAQFVSLQKDVRESDRDVLAGLDIVDTTESLADFDDTAGLLSCLDVVVTVDTSVAHLAGGLGRPVWILLPYRPDYRWLLGRTDSPWYPTARLFRQNEARDYGWVIDQVRHELAAEAAAFRGAPCVSLRFGG